MRRIDGEIELEHGVELFHRRGTVAALHRGLGFPHQFARLVAIGIPELGIGIGAAQHGVVDGLVTAAGARHQFVAMSA